jgi:precorrin-2 dehydrogenase / sirohydrochlorin ferrochelatase
VSLYPLMLDGMALRALVVGGGAVALRKTRALLTAGASVRVVAPAIDAGFAAIDQDRLAIERKNYASDDIGDATLVIAATSSRAVNARVARDARARDRLVNVADAPEDGTCVTPAVHRAGDLVIAVSAGRVPTVAARVRDCIAARYAEPYAAAIAELSALRSRILGGGDRQGWRRVVDAVIDREFCEIVEHGELASRLEPWR